MQVVFEISCRKFDFGCWLSWSELVLPKLGLELSVLCSMLAMLLMLLTLCVTSCSSSPHEFRIRDGKIVVARCS